MFYFLKNKLTKYIKIEDIIYIHKNVKKSKNTAISELKALKIK